MTQAGAIPNKGLTAIQGIDNALELKRDEAIIIHGASGDVGTLAVQFAKLRGARVLATASGEDAVVLVRRLGADTAIDGKRDDIKSLPRTRRELGLVLCGSGIVCARLRRLRI